MTSQAIDVTQVDIWFWSTRRWAAEVLPRNELSDVELAQADALGRQAREFIVDRATLRRILSRYGAIEPSAWYFTRNPCGKPLAQGTAQPPHFNLSHAGEFTVCAVSPGAAVGVDIEAHDNGTALLSVADQYFSESELADLKALPGQHQASAFFDYWTLKEAYLKARGEGLVQPLDSFSFFPRSDDSIGFECDPEHAARADDAEIPWHFRLLRPAPGYTAAIAVQHATPIVRCWAALPNGDMVEAVPTVLGAMLHEETR